METEIFKDDLSKAAHILTEGGLVAVPTETVYGLAGNGMNKDAVARIYEVKGRPAIKPLSLMVSGSEAMSEYCMDIPQAAYTLADKFWPGPLTIVLPAKDTIPDIVLAGGNTVGLRCPDHEKTLELLKLSGVPFAAPSANPSGEESPKTAEEVYKYFNGNIEGIVDGGRCGIGTESTLISLCTTPYRILRQGALDKKDIEDALVEKMSVIGITGPTGSGKTTALGQLTELGAYIIDCDAVYHALLSESSEMLNEIGAAFPGTVEGDVLDRKALGAIVFSDHDKLTQLNAITHKYVIEKTQALLREAAMFGYSFAVIDAIYVVDSGLKDLCTCTVAIVADREVRINRIMNRDGITREYAEARIDSQKDDEYYKERCTYTLTNNSEDWEFIDKCQKLFKEIIR